MVSTGYPSAAQFEVLVALKRYHYLTVDQIMLLTGRTSLRASQQRLKDLFDAGYLVKNHRHWSEPLKPLRPAWSLTARSKAYLEDTGMVVLPPHRPKPYTLNHTLATNDVLLRAELLARDYPAAVELLDLHHDRDMRRWNPPLCLVPDGYINFALTLEGRRARFPILLELDMGTMDRARWESKIKRYGAFFQGSFQSTFHTSAATVAVVVSDDEKRGGQLKRWTEHELKRLQLSALADVFYFGHLSDGLQPETLFCAPRFLPAFRDTYEGLLPLHLAGT